MTKKLLKFFICLLLVTIIWGSADKLNVFAESAPSTETTETTEITEPAPVTISKKSTEVQIGKTITLSVANNLGAVTWKSSDTSVATVSKSGVVKGKACGKVKITATVDGKVLTCSVKVYKSKKYVSKWVYTKGKYTYYDTYGRKITGYKTINGKKYYFDEDGYQRVGWVKVGKYYRFFKIAEGEKGYLISGKKINGITIDKYGKAVVTSSNKNKLKVLIYSNDVVFENTDWRQTKSERLKALYTGFANQELISYKNIGKFNKKSGWPERYAMYYLENGVGDCYTAGCAFAYLAVALGYTDVYAQSSGGHGWAKINGKYYDPNWGSWGTKNMYNGYAVPEKLSGKSGRPNWKKNQTYSVKIG